MSRDVFDLVCAMNRDSVEMQMVVQCAPLFAGLKISNLLILSEDKEDAFYRLLRDSDLSVYFLTRFNGKLVYLLYCHDAMESFLGDKSVKEFLGKEGYEDLSLSGILKRFRERYERHTMTGVEFPHEMGLILGYPLEDVEGFIANGGENYLCVGYWKVYNRPEEKTQIFKSFDRAMERIVKMMSRGISMSDIIGKKQRSKVFI